MKYARRPTQTVNIFRKKDREPAEFEGQFFYSGLGGSIEANVANTFAKRSTGEIGDVVADSAAKCSRKQDPGKTVITQKAPLRQHAGQQQRDVTLKHHEKKNRIDPIAKDEIVKEIEMHKLESEQ
jgi:hypothetical protein